MDGFTAKNVIFDEAVSFVPKDCGCSCHNDPNVKHVAACCHPSQFEELKHV